MATSRSFGGTLLTTWSPMRISPAVMFSSPAIIRSNVDLPQPEGPTSTTNSPLRIETSTPWITAVAPKAFRTSRIATEAIHSSRGCPGSLSCYFSSIAADAWDTRARANHRTFASRKASPTCDRSKQKGAGNCPLQGQAAIDQMRLAGDVAGFIRGQENRECRYFLGSAKPRHRLTRNKVFSHFLERFARRFGHRLDALLERWRDDCAGADCIAANALGDEVGSNGLGQPDYSGFRCAVGVTIGQPFD